MKFSYLVPALVVMLATAAGCATSADDATAEGQQEINEVVTSINLPVELAPGEVRRLNFRSGAAFRVRFAQEGNAPASARAVAELRVTGNGFDRSDVNLEPSIENRPATSDSLAYSVVLRNRDGRYRLRGDLVIEPATASSGTSQRIAVTVDGYVMGDLSSNQATASDSLRKQCDAWVSRLTQLSGADHVESTSCGTPVNVDTYGRFQLTAKPSATVVVNVQAPTATASDISTWTVRGDLSSTPLTAFTSYNDRCTAALQEAKRVYGARFIAGTCEAPTNQDTYGRTDFQGAVRIFAVPREGNATADKSFVLGDLSSSATTALASWADQCKAMQSNLASTDAFAEFRCGAPKNADTYGRFQFSSEPTFSFVSAADAGAGIRSDQTTIKGDLSSQSFSAYQSWSAKCLAEQAAAKSRHGARFLYASCGVPTNIDTYGRTQYQSTFSSLIKPL